MATVLATGPTSPGAQQVHIQESQYLIGIDVRPSSSIMPKRSASPSKASPAGLPGQQL